VTKLAKYLKLSDIFIDIATDETMKGGGKEIAIHHLIKELESKGIKVPEGKMIFVGDSLRGDIGTSLIARGKNTAIFGQGILVLKDKNALIEMEKKINTNPELRHITDNIDVYGFMVDEVPLDVKGSPMMLSRFKDKFLKKL
jgi:hypothetical protein